MTKTIEIIDGKACYKGHDFGVLTCPLCSVFNIIGDGKYEITIVKGDKYLFYKYDYKPDFPEKRYYYMGTVGKEYDEFFTIVCREAFDTIFFIPDKDKRYDITVKKVK